MRKETVHGSHSHTISWHKWLLKDWKITVYRWTYLQIDRKNDGPASGPTVSDKKQLAETTFFWDSTHEYVAEASNLLPRSFGKALQLL